MEESKNFFLEISSFDLEHKRRGKRGENNDGNTFKLI